MKRLLLLMLLAPAFASASGPPCVDTACQLFITSGSMTADGERADFSTSGHGFTTNGFFVFSIEGADAGPFGPAGTSTGIVGPGDLYRLSWFEGCTDGPYSMSGALGSLPLESLVGDFAIGLCGGGGFDAPPFTITGAGTFTVPFSFSATAFIATNTCAMTLICGVVVEHGGGTVTLDVLPWPYSPNTFYVASGVFTFNAPEPSTTSLLLVGFGGLAVLGWRRRSRVGSGLSG